MPVSIEVAESNRSQTARLKALAARLTPEGLAARLPNGWTVAVALVHIAFWDRQRLCLMRRWAAGIECHGGYDGELFNETLLPFLEAIPPDRAATLAIESAEEVDAFLLAVPDEVVAAALARPDRPNLDRGLHREDHLDRIEEALAGRAAIEWHDSELLAVSVEAGEILLDLRAIVHRSQGAPGVESGTVWVQPASVVLSRGRHEGMWPPLPCPIADGRVETDGHDYDNLTPCPFRSNGRALLDLHLATGDRVRIEADLVTLTFTGEPEYLEDFAPQNEDGEGPS